MGWVSSFLEKLKNTFPFIATKFVSFLFILIIIGMLIGFLAAKSGYSAAIFIIPLAALSVMWYKLDEGFLVLIVFLILFYLFPNLFL